MFSLALLSSVALAATVHTVDPAGVCGGNPSCHTTIGAAIAAAVDGDTVTVYAGTYTENVSISLFDDLHLVAADPSQATLLGALDLGVGGAMTPPTAVINGGGAGYCVAVDQSSDVSVIGFRMTNCPTGVQVFNSTDTVVEGNYIGGGVSMGIIDGTGADGTRITGNSVAGASSMGILLRGSRSPYVADNRVNASPYGTYVSNTWRAQLVNNRFTNSSSVGMYIIGAAETRLERNTSTGSVTTNLEITSSSTDTSYVGNRLLGLFSDSGAGSAGADNN